MDRVQRGEHFTVTRNGQPVAELVPILGPRHEVPTEELVAAMADLPRLDWATMRAEADTFFADDADRIG
jgi:antitoxin (DNA-binding transcriptional repressor) of toxin-antitoxin stability system